VDAPSLQPLRHLRCHTACGPLRHLGLRTDAGAAHRDPPRAPVDGEGDLWGDLQAVSWMAGSPLLLLKD
jgi:hypothetical protein